MRSRSLALLLMFLGGVLVGCPEGRRDGLPSVLGLGQARPGSSGVSSD